MSRGCRDKVEGAEVSNDHECHKTFRNLNFIENKRNYSCFLNSEKSDKNFPFDPILNKLE